MNRELDRRIEGLAGSTIANVKKRPSRQAPAAISHRCT